MGGSEKMCRLSSKRRTRRTGVGRGQGTRGKTAGWVFGCVERTGEGGGGYLGRGRLGEPCVGVRPHLWGGVSHSYISR